VLDTLGVAHRTGTLAWLCDVLPPPALANCAIVILMLYVMPTCIEFRLAVRFPPSPATHPCLPGSEWCKRIVGLQWVCMGFPRQ
jgi:hypothetical protein